jgi:hypothetical protein
MTSFLDRVAFVALLVAVGIGSVLIAAYGIAGVVALGVIDLFSKDE